MYTYYQIVEAIEHIAYSGVLTCIKHHRKYLARRFRIDDVEFYVMDKEADEECRQYMHGLREIKEFRSTIEQFREVLVEHEPMIIIRNGVNYSVRRLDESPTKKTLSMIPQQIIDKINELASIRNYLDREARIEELTKENEKYKNIIDELMKTR